MTSSGTGTHAWQLPSLLTPHLVEQQLALIPDGTTTLRLRVGQHGLQVTPGGPAALQGMLCLLHRDGVRTELSVPNLTFEGERAERIFNLDPKTEDAGPITATEKTLAWSVAGLVLGQLCRPAADSDATARIAPAQTEALAKQRGLVGSGRGKAFAVLSKGDTRTRLGMSPLDRQSSLHARLEDLLGLGPIPRHHRLSDWFQQIVLFVFEATENTFDHGRLSLDGGPIDQVRFISIDTWRIGDSPGEHPVGKLAQDPHSPLHQYLTRLEAKKAADHGHNLRIARITVADGGVGIAARMAQDFAIYDGDPNLELKHVQHAMSPDGTSTPSGDTGRGNGFRKMLRATHELHAFFEARTGRFALHRHYLESDGATRPRAFRHRDSEEFDIHGGDQTHQLLAGTAVSLTLPFLTQ